MSEESEKKQKRVYRKGNPLTRRELTQAYIARKKNNFKELMVYITPYLKDAIADVSKMDGLTQSEWIEKNIRELLDKRGIKVEEIHS